MSLLVLVALTIQIAFCESLFAQSRESMIKAGYIEKFTHFVQWPKKDLLNEKEDKFVIAVIGDNSISDILRKIFIESGRAKDSVRIVIVENPEEIKNCHLLFISGSQKNNLDRILLQTTGKPILTISDSKGFCEKGVIINMFKEGDYIRYEINRRSLDKSGLIINSLLLNYAVII